MWRTCCFVGRIVRHFLGMLRRQGGLEHRRLSRHFSYSSVSIRSNSNTNLQCKSFNSSPCPLTLNLTINKPTSTPSDSPSKRPSKSPSKAPSKSPTLSPTVAPCLNGQSCCNQPTCGGLGCNDLGGSGLASDVPCGACNDDYSCRKVDPAILSEGSW